MKKMRLLKGFLRTMEVLGAIAAGTTVGYGIRVGFEPLLMHEMNRGREHSAMELDPRARISPGHFVGDGVHRDNMIGGDPPLQIEYEPVFKVLLAFGEPQGS